jgi:broad specificity phosphatase PhoE
MPGLYSPASCAVKPELAADGSESVYCRLMRDDPRAPVADSAFFSDIEEDTRFYIVRHGRSEGNSRCIIQGRRDFPLDEAGRAQAASAGAWLAGKSPASILSSPLRRAAETARIIGAACGLGISTHECLEELDTGIFSGISLEEARKLYPEAYSAFEWQSWEGVPGAESSARLYARAMAAWELLRGRALSGDRSIVCVSHGGLIQWLVRATFGCTSWMPLLPTGNCGIFELIVEPTKEEKGAYLQWRLLNFQVLASSISQIAPVF